MISCCLEEQKSIIYGKEMSKKTKQNKKKPGCFTQKE